MQYWRIAFCLAGWYAPYAYLYTLVTSALWVVYGLDWGLVPLLRLNATGAGLAAVYIGLFLWRSDAADRRRTYLLRLIAGGAALLVGAFCIDQFVSKAMYGCVCSVVSWVASVAPFYKIVSFALPTFVLGAMALLLLGKNDDRMTTVSADGVARQEHGRDTAVGHSSDRPDQRVDLDRPQYPPPA